jgi:hypothetical protein
MNALKSPAVSVYKKSVAMLTISACVFSWGCANLQDRFSKAVGTAPTLQTQNVTKQAQTSASSLEAAAKQDISSNRTVAEDKFNTMLQQNGIAK